MVNKKIFQKGSIYLCKRLHVYATCLRTHIIKHMIISVICTNMRKGNKFNHFSLSFTLRFYPFNLTHLIILKKT